MIRGKNDKKQQKVVSRTLLVFMGKILTLTGTARVRKMTSTGMELKTCSFLDSWCVKKRKLNVQ